MGQINLSTLSAHFIPYKMIYRYINLKMNKVYLCLLPIHSRKIKYALNNS